MGLITIACPSCKQLTEWFSGNPDQRCHRCKYEAKQSPLPGAQVDTSIFDGNRWHQIWPRPAVEGDIYPVAPALYWFQRRRANCWVVTPPPYRTHVRWEGPPANLQNLERPHASLTPKNAESEERSTYHSSTDGRIPLSFKGRHLLQNLRFATARAIADGEWHEDVSVARAAIARRMGELEAYAAGYAQQRATVAALTQEIGDLQHQLKNYEPVSKYNGLSIEQWQRRALNAESALLTTLIWKDRALKAESELKTNEDFIGLLQARLLNARNHLARVRYHCDMPEVGDRNGQAFDP